MRQLLQLTLDLFDPAPPKAEPEPAAPPAPEQPAAPAVAAAPAESLDAVLAPATFHHPRANRQAVLGTTFVAYEFKRGRRRSIGFSVGAEGLTVSAPKWVPLREVDQAVQGKAAWILSKLDAARERHERVESARIAWQDGAAFPVPRRAGDRGPRFARRQRRHPEHRCARRCPACRASRCTWRCPTPPSRRRSAMPCRPG